MILDQCFFCSVGLVTSYIAQINRKLIKTDGKILYITAVPLNKLRPDSLI